MTGAHARQKQQVGFWRIWLPCFALFGLVMAMWTLASPVASAADEPTTIVRAAAAVRGQLVGSQVGPNVAESTVRTQVVVPATFRLLNNCYSFHPTESAACVAERPVPSSRTLGPITTLVGRYPPLYYLIVGLPSYLPGGSSAILFMRMAGVVVNAALLAIAVAAIRRWAGSRVLLVGFAFAVSPMVLYYSAVINPSGLELCSAVCLWVTATIWAVDYPEHAPRGLLWTVTVSAATLIQARPASPVWPVLIAVALAPLVWKRRSWRQPSATLKAIRHRPELWPMLLILGASWAFAAAWLVVVHSFRMVGGNFPPPGTPERQLIKESIEYMPTYLQQAVGVLGWLDTYLPPALIYFWYVAVLALLGAGLIFSNLRGRAVLLIVMILCFAIPVGGTVADVHSHGFTSQGRYFLPLFVGMPIVAAALLGKAHRERHFHLPQAIGTSLIQLSLGAVGAAQMVAFGTALRRYLVGVDGPILPTVHFKGEWHPPLPGVWLDILALIGSALLYWFIGRPFAREDRSFPPPFDTEPRPKLSAVFESSDSRAPVAEATGDGPTS